VFLLRLGLRLIFGVVILVAALAVAGDFYARSQTEKLVSQRVKAATGAQSVSVDLRTFPFLWHVVLSNIPEVKVVAHEVPAGGFRMTEVTVDARGVKVDRNVLVSSRQVKLDSVRSAQVTILLTGTDMDPSSSLPAGAAVTVVGQHLLELTYEGRTVARVDLTSSPLVPACSYSLEKVRGGYSLSCTVSPVPATVLDALSSHKP
jgi:hypothetical protein